LTLLLAIPEGFFYSMTTFLRHRVYRLKNKQKVITVPVF